MKPGENFLMRFDRGKGRAVKLFFTRKKYIKIINDINNPATHTVSPINALLKGR